MTPRERVLAAIEAIKDELNGRVKELVGMGKLVEAQRLEQRTRFDLEMLQGWGTAGHRELHGTFQAPNPVIHRPRWWTTCRLIPHVPR